jgi:hypothetical protein
MSPLQRRVVRGFASLPVLCGMYCATYHWLFYALWALVFGDSVWPWPRWSLYMLVVVPGAAAAGAWLYVLFAPCRGRSAVILVVLVAVSTTGLVLYASQVVKCMFQLGFAP